MQTPSQTPGPFFKADTPERSDLREADTEGSFILMGHVVDRRCRPRSGSVVDVWHADARGRYDNEGFRYRGHQICDAEGAFQFSTIRPGRYPGRTPHYHVTVRNADGSALTTQLYFPDAPQNQRDFLFDPRLNLALSRRGESEIGQFLLVR